MKRIVIIISLTVSIISILFMAAPYLLRLTGLDVPVKRFVLSKLTNDSESLDIEAFNLSQNAIHFNNFVFISKNRQYKLEIESIDVVFNFFTLLASLNQPLKSLQSIHIIKPRFSILQYNMAQTEKAVTTDSVQQAEIISLIRKLKELPQIKFFTLKEGEILYLIDDRSKFTLA